MLGLPGAVPGAYVTPGARACLQRPHGTPYRFTLPPQLEHALPNTPFPLMHSPNERANEHNENGPAPCMTARIAEAACLRSLWLRVNRLERLTETARRAQRPQWRTHAEQALRASNEYMRRATN
mgnify:CR=1 FL=1